MNLLYLDHSKTIFLGRHAFGQLTYSDCDLFIEDAAILTAVKLIKGINVRDILCTNADFRAQRFVLKYWSEIRNGL